MARNSFFGTAFSKARPGVGVTGGARIPPRLWHVFALAGAILALFIVSQSFARDAQAQSSVSAIRCTFDVATSSAACDTSSSPFGSIEGSSPSVIGGQNAYLKVAPSNASAANGTFQFDATVQNLLANALGTGNGTDADAAGVRLFVDGISVTGDSGDVSVANADGSGDFTGSDQPYFQYDEILQPDQVSAAKSLQFAYDPGVTSFTVDFLVSTRAEAKLVINEVMVNPSGTTFDSDGEWFEVYNAGTLPIQVQGFKISDSAASVEQPAHTIASSLRVDRGDYVVFGQNTDFIANGGVPVDYSYGSSLTLATIGDAIRLRAPDDLLLDFVQYASAASSAQDGVARELKSPPALEDNRLIDGSNWANAPVTSVYGPGGRGTPGFTNDNATPPPASLPAPDLQTASDTGASNTDNVTNDDTPTFGIAGVETGSEVELLRDGTVVAIGTAAGTTISLTDLSAPDGTHTYTARQSTANGTSAQSSGLSVTIDTTVPGVTIDQASSQDDPATALPIRFTVEFDEEVTGFGPEDVQLSGTAGLASAQVAVSGDGPTYTVEVSNITSSGTVTATVGAGAATDASGNGSTASTSTDNQVTYDRPVAFTVDRSDDPDLTTNPTAGDCTEATADDCSLRGAITAANATPGADAINFAIPGAGVRTISPGSPLPFITEAVAIDGYTQPGSSPNTLADGNDAVLNIELDGTDAGDADGLHLTADGSNSVVRGLVINDFDPGGMFVGGNNIKIEGNFVGTDPSGTQAEDNEDDGVIIGGTGNTVGGATPGARNLVSGNDDDGIFLEPGSSDTEVLGNYVGTKRDGRTRLANDGEGVNIVGSNDNRIGGTTPAEANRIAFNSSDGVQVEEFDPDDANGNRILNNAIFSNKDWGIDLLGANGPNPIDTRDLDDGPNTLQNRPFLASATTSGSRITIQGRLKSAPDSSFTVRFFANRGFEQFGYEGRTFLGQKSVTTDASGEVTFTRVLAEEVQAGQGITATATGPGGNTSEFSGPRQVVQQ